MQYVLNYLGKMSGGNPRPPAMPMTSLLLAGLGAFCAIAAVALAQDTSGLSLMMAPFGASCFLAFAVPDSPLAQPRHIIFGHFISSAIGLIILTVVGDSWSAMALAVGLAVAMMLLTRTGHPPAGADPLVVFALQPTWSYLLFPVLIGAIIVTIVALIFNNLRPDVRYPKYW